MERLVTAANAMEASAIELIVTPAGTIRAIYGEQIPLEALGPPTIRRASTVEPDAQGRWHVDLSPVGGPQLGPFARRSQGLAAEVRWLQEVWLAPMSASAPPLAVHPIPITGDYRRSMKSVCHVPRPSLSAALILVVLGLVALVLVACDDDSAAKAEAERQANVQRQAQLQAQVQAEQAKRLQAEAAAREATESRNAWVLAVGAGACVAVLIVGLLGIHIGSRALARAGPQPPASGAP